MYIFDNATMRRALVNRARIVAIFDVLLIIIIALLVMLPRLLSPAFGLLDDGQILRVARQVLAGNYTFPATITQNTGRFFPVYWYYFVPQYALWGARPLGFYFVSFLSLSLTALNLRWIIGSVSNSRLAGLVAGGLFMLAPPIIENYYTIGKSEPIVSLMLSLSVVCLVASARIGERWRQLLFISSVLLLPLAYLTKETALVMIPISVSWAIGFAWARRGETEDRSRIRILVWYSAANLICGAGARLLASTAGVSGIAAGRYTRSYRLSLDVLAHSLNGQLQLLARDYGFLIVLLLMLTLLVIWRRSVFTEGKLNWLIAAAAIWAAGWLAVLLPWSNSLQEYYLLPASLGLCALGGIGSELLWRVVNTRHTETAARVTFFAALVCGVGAVGFVACGLVNFGSNGRLQITIDRQNMAMIDSLARSAPVGSTVLFNLREPNEYVFEAGLFLGLVEQRTDLRVGYLSTRTLGQLAGTTLVVMMRSDTPSVQTVRMAGGGPSQDIWNSSVLTLIGPAAARIYHGAEVISPVWVNTNQWLCWAASALHIKDNWQVSGKLCPDRASFQSETIEYGWDIYAIQPANTVPRGRAAMGVFEPGTATWHLRLGISEAATERTVRFGQPGDIPLVGDWDGDGMDGIGVFNPRSGMWSLDNDIDGRSDLVLRWSAMHTGDIPLAGDWNGDGTTSIGFFRPSDVTWHLRNSNTDGSEEVPVFRFGLPTDLPLVADWDGDGKDNVAIYRSSVGQVIPRITGDHKPFYVTQGDIPVPTSWRRTAPAALSTFAQGQWSVRYIDCRCVAPSPLAPAHVSFGQDGDVPIAGGWYER